jgi:hypothetical protein
MPDNRKHRGQHPADAQLFDFTQWPKLQQAVRDMSWLLSHGYAEKSVLKLVGDRYRLRERQRLAVLRSSCSSQAALHRRATELNAEQLSGHVLYIDGFNVLITIESALSRGLIFEGVDSCYRDLASIHGSYKKVLETEKAILLIGELLDKLSVEKSIWYFDRPVSNSGKLKQIVLDLADKMHWNVEVLLHSNPDKVLKDCGQAVASTDSVVLDAATAWFNLTRFIIEKHFQELNVLPMGQLAVSS